LTETSNFKKDNPSSDLSFQNGKAPTTLHSTERGDTTIVEEENAILRQQHLILKSLLEKENEKNGRHKQRMEKLATVLQDREKRISELQHYEQILKTSSEKKQDLESSIENQRHLFLQFQTDNKNLTSNLEESQQHAKQLQRVIHFLREKAEEAHLEVNQFHEDLESAHQTISILSEQNKTAKEEVVTAHKQLEQKQFILTEAQEEITILQQQFEHLKKTVATTRQQLSSSDHSLSIVTQQVEQFKNDNNHLHEQLNEVLSQYHEVKESNERLKITCEEQEQNVRAAQQHLAKKLKEVALQSEKNEEQQQLISELQTALADSFTKTEDVKHDLELQLQQEKFQQEQLQTTLKAAETHVQQWEHKYSQLQSKFHELERQNKELKALEERQIQVQGLLNNVGLLMGGGTLTSTNSSSQTLPVFPSAKLTFGTALESVSSTPFLDSQEAKEEQHKPMLQVTEDTHNLFDVPDTFVRYKQTLFD
jgi:chromosome segregation ATPase